MDNFDNTCCNTGTMSSSLPTNIKNLLNALVGKPACIVLKNGTREPVRVDAVSGDLLICTGTGCGSCPNIRFINIGCICGVIVSCPTALSAVVR